MVWGSLIGAAGNLIGAGIEQFGGDSGRRDAAQANEAIQREFAQNGVRWRVADAQAAGIHPGLALGMQPVQFSPSTFIEGDKRTSEFLSRAGHDIGRAVDKTRTADERVTSRVEALQLERGQLENDLLRAQISKLRTEAVGPPMVDPANPGVRMFGTSDATRITEEAMKRTMGAEGRPYMEPGAVPGMGFERTPSGYAPLPSKDAKERMEDMMIPEMAWGWRNFGTANLGMGYPPPETWLSAFPGAVGWRWSHFRQEWQPEYRSKVQQQRHYEPRRGREPSLWTGAP